MIVGKKIIGGLTGLLGACVLSSAVYAADYNLKLHCFFFNFSAEEQQVLWKVQRQRRKATCMNE